MCLICLRVCVELSTFISTLHAIIDHACMGYAHARAKDDEWQNKRSLGRHIFHGPLWGIPKTTGGSTTVDVIEEIGPIQAHGGIAKRTRYISDKRYVAVAFPVPFEASFRDCSSLSATGSTLVGAIAIKRPNFHGMVMHLACLTVCVGLPAFILLSYSLGYRACVGYARTQLIQETADAQAEDNRWRHTRSPQSLGIAELFWIVPKSTGGLTHTAVPDPTWRGGDASTSDHQRSIGDNQNENVQEPSISAAGPSGAGGPPSPPRGGEAEKAETRGTKKDSYHMYQSVSRTWRLRIRESVFMVYAIIDTVKWNSVSRHNFGTLHDARCTLHVARGTLNDARGTLHDARCTLHAARGTLHDARGTLHVARGTLHDARGALHVARGTLHVARGTLHDARCTLHVARGTLHVARCTLHVARCTLHIARCTLHAARCTMHAARYTMHAARCTMHAARCTMHAARCTLHAARCTMHVAEGNWSHGRYGFPGPWKILIHPEGERTQEGESQ
jgi:tetraspanin-3